MQISRTTRRFPECISSAQLTVNEQSYHWSQGRGHLAGASSAIVGKMAHFECGSLQQHVLCYRPMSGQ
jgi:hypothetical protein